MFERFFVRRFVHIIKCVTSTLIIVFYSELSGSLTHLQGMMFIYVQRFCVSKLYGFVNLVRVIFQNTCRVKSFFPYKDRFSCSQRSKIVYKASCWDCDFFCIKTKRRLHDRKTEHFKALTQDGHASDHVVSTRVTTSNGTISKSSLLESPTCSAKLKKHF